MEAQNGKPKKNGINANHLRTSLILILLTWLMTGLSVDDEFYDEYNIFLKHRPTLQYYFRSPLGMQDMPSGYPAELRQKEAVYDEFIWGEHWSSGLDWVAILLVLGTVSYSGYVFIVCFKEKLKMKNKSILYYSGLLPLISGSTGFYYLGSFYYWLSLLFLVLGIFLVALSDKKVWLKILTVILLPIISVLLFFVIIFSFADLP